MAGRPRDIGGTMDQFAENLAEGLGVADAATALGKSPEYGHAMLQRLRKRLGPQAV